MEIKPNEDVLPVIDVSQGVTKQYKTEQVGKTTEKVICHTNGDILTLKHLESFQRVRDHAENAQVLLLVSKVPSQEVIDAVRDILHQEKKQFLGVYLPNDTTEFQCPVFHERVLLDVNLRTLRNMATVFGPLHVLAFKPAAIGDVRNYHELIASRAASLHFFISDDKKGAERMREQLQKLQTTEEFDEEIYDFDRPNPRKVTPAPYDDEDDDDTGLDTSEMNEDIELEDDEEEAETDLKKDPESKRKRKIQSSINPKPQSKEKSKKKSSRKKKKKASAKKKSDTKKTSKKKTK